VVAPIGLDEIMNLNQHYKSPQVAQNCKDRVMRPEQFEQVVAAIASHKYSWACVLILQFAGYNPLQYIPYRTYNRIVRENSRRSRVQDVESGMKLDDLGYENSAHDPRHIQGGWMFNHL
jgi:hypothetical protein